MNLLIGGPASNLLEASVSYHDRGIANGKNWAGQNMIDTKSVQYVS